MRHTFLVGGGVSGHPHLLGILPLFGHRCLSLSLCSTYVSVLSENDARKFLKAMTMLLSQLAREAVHIQSATPHLVIGNQIITNVSGVVCIGLQF